MKQIMIAGEWRTMSEQNKAMHEALESIAQTWDGCEVDVTSVGAVDVGEALRKQFSALSQPAPASEQQPTTDAAIRELAHKHLTGTGDHCIINFARALLSQQAAESSECRRDTQRLDWLDAVNQRTNESYNTTYGWKFDINHNRAALTDHNWPAMSVRQAIDAAIAARSQTEEGDK